MSRVTKFFTSYPRLSWLGPPTLVVIAFCIQILMRDWLGSRGLIFIYPAMFIGCLFGNRIASIIATFGGAAFAWIFFYQHVADAQIYLSIAVFIISGIISSIIAEIVLRSKIAQFEISRKLEETNLNLETSVDERTKELSQAYGFVESVLENIPNMIFVKEAKTLKFVRFNRAGAKLLGLDKADLIGKNDYDFFPPEQADFFQSKDRKVLAEKQIVDIAEEEILTKDKGIRILHTKKIPIYSNVGEPEFLLGISEDITDKKKLEEERLQLVTTTIEKKEAERATQRLRFLADAAADLSSTLDLDEILNRLTKIAVPALADWCSVQMVQPDGNIKQLAVYHRDPSKADLVKELHHKYPPPKDYPTGPSLVLRTGKSELIERVPLDRLKWAARDEHHYHILEGLGFRSYICSAIRVGGKVIGTLSLITTDESHREFTEADLRFAEDLCARAGFAIDNARLYREAQTINRVKDEFLATLSHELRTPINVIQGQADILLSELGSGNSELRRPLEAISRNSRLQTRIVSDLLDVSSIITGKITYTPSRVSPGDIAQSVANTAQEAAKKKEITIDCDVTKAPPAISADPTRLQQILSNLANNAVKFTPAGGKIEIRVYEDRDSCVFQIKDNGIGIEKEFLPYVFDRFRQEDSSMSRKYGGLGLGLSIVRNLVEIHGGTVDAASDGKGKGTNFTVKLPINVDSSQRSQDIEVSRPMESTRRPQVQDKLDKLNILLIDDSPDNLDLISSFLQKAGAKVLEAESAESARGILKTEKVDLILSDIGMPEENGLEFIRKLRAQNNMTPAIALTAYVRPEEVSEALKAGFQAHVSKPVTPTALVSGISQVMMAVH